MAKVDDLTTISHDFKRLARHGDLFLVEQYPILELVYDFVKHLVKVLIHSRISKAQLSRLLKQVFAQQIFLLDYLQIFLPFLTQVAVLILFI